MKKKSIQMIVVGVIIFLFTEFIRLFDSGLIFDLRRLYNRSVIEPLEFFSLILFLVGLYLLFFNQYIQNKWWGWFRWAILSLFLFICLINYEGTGGFTSPAVVVIYWGSVAGVVTFLHTLYHRFYLKTGVQENN
jgi:hypothetical protein